MQGYHPIEPSNNRVDRVRSALHDLETFDAKPLLVMLKLDDFASFAADLRAAGKLSKQQYADAQRIGVMIYFGVEFYRSAKLNKTEVAA